MTTTTAHQEATVNRLAEVFEDTLRIVQADTGVREKLLRLGDLRYLISDALHTEVFTTDEAFEEWWSCLQAATTPEKFRARYL